MSAVATAAEATAFHCQNEALPIMARRLTAAARELDPSLETPERSSRNVNFADKYQAAQRD
jgi:hypothetical protein